MDFSGFVVQMLNGLAGASSLFLVSAGLSLIFGVTRIVNFAHGSFFMVGIYAAYSLVAVLGNVLGSVLGVTLGFWSALLLAALAVGVLGAAVEVLLLRRLYRAPELFQLLATFALGLVIKDGVLWFWGAEDLLGPRAPGLAGSIEVLGRQFPTYDLFLIAAGPLVLGALWLLLNRTRWGTLVRACAQDREMVSALGVNQAWLFTAVFALGSLLAGLGGALQLPRESANLDMDLNLIGAAFVVVVVGGMGSISGAFVAALLIAELKAVCIWLGLVDVMGVSLSFSKLTLVVEFVVMAVVLVARPWGLLGKPQPVARGGGLPEPPLQPPTRASRAAVAMGLAALAAVAVWPGVAAQFPYAVVLLTDVLVAVLFAASLHFIMGPAGMHSFGHAAYFGLGAYGAALALRGLQLPMEAALLVAPALAAAGAAVYGWFCVRLSGVYLAMLTLAFAQITWALVYQWDTLTGGSNGLSGVWPAPWLADSRAFYGLTLGLVAAGVLFLQRALHAPFGYALRAGRDAPLRAEALGMNVKALQWAAFVMAGTLAGLAGALYAFSKGSISPETLGVSRSIDGLVMVLLGGLQTLAGPVVGAAVFTGLHDTVARNTDYWRAVLGGTMLALVLLFPQGLAGFAQQVWRYFQRWVARRLTQRGRA